MKTMREARERESRLRESDPEAWGRYVFEQSAQLRQTIAEIGAILPIWRALAAAPAWAPAWRRSDMREVWAGAWDFATNKTGWVEWVHLIEGGADPETISDRAAELMREHSAQVRAVLAATFEENSSWFDFIDSAVPVVRVPTKASDSAAWVQSVARDVTEWRGRLLAWQYGGRFHILASKLEHVEAPTVPAVSQKHVFRAGQRLAVNRRGHVLDGNSRACGVVVAETLAAPSVGALSTAPARCLIAYLVIEATKLHKTAPAKLDSDGIVFSGGCKALQRVYEFGGSGKPDEWADILSAGASVKFIFDNASSNLWEYVWNRETGNLHIYPGGVLRPGFVHHLTDGSQDRVLVPVLDLRKFEPVLASKLRASEFELVDLLLLALVNGADKDGWISGLDWSKRSKLRPEQIDQVLAAWADGPAPHVETCGGRVRLGVRYSTQTQFILAGLERRERSRLGGRQSAIKRADGPKPKRAK